VIVSIDPATGSVSFSTAPAPKPASAPTVGTSADITDV
jgi:hypothetical protein